MAIYTRTGDAGTTALFTGQRVSKTHPRVEAYGTLDELNAALSLCVCAAENPQHRQLLENIQLQLFWFSAELASESEEPTPEQRYISSEEIAALEAAIDIAMGRVPPCAALFYQAAAKPPADCTLPELWHAAQRDDWSSCPPRSPSDTC
ncbi:propanediol utilization: B12 related [Citrobacter freundii]|nr:propanediol utilization: B12 related [Citrobacter freundii]